MFVFTFFGPQSRTVSANLLFTDTVRDWQSMGNFLKAEGVPTIVRWEVRLGSIGGNTP